MKLFRRSTKKVYFLHIGKNAGNQIKILGSQLNSLQFESKIIFCGHGRKLVDLPKDAMYFFSIRNPVKRFRSGFYSRKRKGQPLNDLDWNPDEKRAFERFEHANDLAEALFRTDETATQAFWAMSGVGHVRDHQFDWFRLAGNFLEDRPPIFIVRQEHFEEDFSSLLHRLGTGLTFDDLEVSEDKNTSHRFDYSEAPTLSQLAISNLELWYRRDVEFYDTCVAWISKAKAASTWET